MRRWVMVVVAAAALYPAGWAQAQSRDDYDDDDRSDRDRFALAVGVGLVEPADEVETYLTAALRIGVSGRGDRGAGEEGIRGYIEPEIGYWEASGEGREGSDLLLGVNLVGVIPLGPVDSFFGAGAGAHFIDTSLLENDPFADGSETKLGANAHFGLDLYITESLSAFGVGRFDLVQGSDDSVQSKVFLGLRARF
ncbi:MAG TPA: hypothetical protein VLE27_09950 [Thermoanaerobaculia bacterium]|nr:hypothetical protein [Thermoanaerobaculia bacterium]